MRGLTLVLGVAAAANPVSKVVDLLREMKAKVAADGKEEEKVYNKYACWCEKTTERKVNSIDLGKTNIESLSNKILETKGKLETLDNEISKLQSDIKEVLAAQKEAQQLREKENAAFQAEKGEMEEAVGALEKAIRLLSGAGTGKGDLMAVFASVVRVMPSARLSEKDTKTMESLMQNPTQLAQYSPQSATVQGILKDMYDTFAVNMENNMMDESSKQKLFEQFMDDKNEELGENRRVLTKKQGEHADATRTLSMSIEAREDAMEQLASDQKFFQDADKSCTDKANEWTERSRLRDEELDGINKAIEILDSEDARKLFTNAVATFVQVDSDTLAPVRAKALAVLTKKAKTTRSTALTSVITALKAGGHFDKIIESIDTMIQALNDEETQDRKDNDECIEKETKNKHKHEDLNYGIARLENKIDKLNDRKTKLETQITNVEKETEEHVDMMEQAKADREAAHDRFEQAKADDTAAIALLQQASKALESYSKNNALLQKAPEFKRSKDDAPEAKFSKKDSRKQANNGILAILAQITENLQREIAEGAEQEANDQAEYEKQRADDRQTHQTLKDTRSDLQAEVAETKADIGALEQDKTNTEGQRDTVVDVLKEIKPGCDWIRQNFDNRRFLRKQEVEGLMDAKAVLAGADLSGSFLQRK